MNYLINVALNEYVAVSYKIPWSGVVISVPGLMGSAMHVDTM